VTRCGARRPRSHPELPISGYRAFPAFIEPLFASSGRGSCERGGRPARRQTQDAIVAACDECSPESTWINSLSMCSIPVPGLFHMNVNEVACQTGRTSSLAAARNVRARGPERPREHGPVNERRHTHGDAPRGAGPHQAAVRRARELAAHRRKGGDVRGVVKPGRTTLQDAVPSPSPGVLRWADRVAARGPSSAGRAELCELGIGGSRWGPGSTSTRNSRQRVCVLARRVVRRADRGLRGTLYAMQSWRRSSDLERNAHGADRGGISGRR